MRFLPLLLCLSMLSCSDDTERLDSGTRPRDSGVDTGTTDADPEDTGAADAGYSDADPNDADPVDADPFDAEPLDADPQDGDTPETGHPDAIADVGFEDSGASDAACPPAPSCNWCGGTTLYDGNGCVAGYECANGVDPCSTYPCSHGTEPSGCNSDEVCEADLLCWPGFLCGEVDYCNLQTQYCMTMSPGMCGGPPLPDGGTCPPNCTPTMCGNDMVCLCESVNCQPLPTGCNDCNCVPHSPPICSCSGNAQTGLTVHCMGA